MNLWKLTGGRPMICVERCRFIDRVSGTEVGLYRDRLGREWFAESRWALFRMANTPSKEKT